MKKILLISFLMIASSLQSFAGWDNGNAGDVYASEFILSGRDIVQRLELLFENNKAVYDTTALRGALASTQVTSEDHVMLNGEEVDAANYPAQHLIKVKRSRWQDLRRATETKNRLQLVLHEYLWVSGTDDTNFKVSEHLIDLLNVANFSPGEWWNPVNPVNYVQAKLSFDPGHCAFGQTGKFDVRATAETVTLETTGECQNDYRKVVITKSTGITPPSSNVHGMFHKFDIKVLDNQGQVQGQMGFEPEWGSCLLPENGACQVSGTMSVGGVDLVFWFLRD